MLFSRHTNSLYSLSLFLCLIIFLATAMPVAAQSAQQDAPNSVAEESTVARIRNRDGLLLAGVKQDFKPFGFRNESGDIVGFDVDIIRAMAEIWGVAVEFVPVTSGNRIDKLLAGDVDIIGASMTHTRPRDADIDYSQTYFLDGQSLLVNKASGINDIYGLAEKTVAAVEGSTSIEQIRQYADQEGVPISVAPFTDYAAALVALGAGQVDALTTDRGFLLQSAQDNPQFEVVGERFTQEPYGLGVRSGDSYFRNLVDFTLQQVYSNGAYEAIFEKWFPGENPYAIQLLPGEWPYTFSTSPDEWSPPDITRMAQIIQDRELAAGVKHDYPPFGYLDESNTVIGFEIDIAREFARRWLGDPEAVRLVRVTAGSGIPTLAGGEIDLLIAGVSHHQEDDDTIDFSQTYLMDGQSLLTERNSGIRGLDDLDGRTVGAVSGSTALANIELLAAAEGQTIEVIPFQEHVGALRALEAGYVDVLAADSRALEHFAFGNPDYDVVGGLLSQEHYAVGVPNFDAGFRDLVNFTLQEMRLDGAYDAIYAKWFDDDASHAIELWPGSSPRSSSIRLSNIAAASAITPQPLAVAQEAATTPTPTATPTSTAASVLLPTASAPTAPRTIQAVTQAVIPATTPTALPTATLPPTPASGRYVTIPTEYGVFARTSTSTESESVRLLPNRTLYEALARTVDENWIQVLLDGGERAWVYAGVVNIAPEQLNQLPLVLVNETGESVATVTPTPVVPQTAPAPTPTQLPASVQEVIPPDGITYIVQPGDYLALIAQRYYGDQLRWPLIYEANRDVVGPNPALLESGVRLVILPPP